MYDIPYHKEKDNKTIREFLGKYPFAFLSGCDEENKPIATQLPLFIENIEGEEMLRGHMMKGTDHHRAFATNEDVLAVFTGKHTYVSGTWYSRPHTPSTWNYMSVHVRGKIRFVNEEELEAILQKVSLHFEDQEHQSATVYENLPSNVKQKALKMIVGFEIEIGEIDTVFKLSQDRDADSYLNIIKKLKAKDGDARVIAAEMEKRAKDLFPHKE